MQQAELRRILQRTLDDGRLSRAERRALEQLLADGDAGPRQRMLYRSVAFELAREAMADPRDRDLLGWLEDLLKVLSPAAESEAVAEVWFSPGPDCVGAVQRLLQRCQRTADLCIFTVTDDRVAGAIRDAHRRGVQVRLISDDDKAFDRGSDVARLARQGVPVRTDRSEHHMHHKFALFDRRLLATGSYNWTRGAAEHNRENLIVTSQPALVAPFCTEFDRLWESLG